jgi:hypothetical protein
MITLQDAYIKAKNVAKVDGLTLLTTCSDYEDVWGFEFMPPTFDPKDSGTYIGGGYDVIISKKTGEIWKYNPFVHGFDLYGKSKNVSVKQFKKDNISLETKAKKKQNRVPAVAVAS